MRDHLARPEYERTVRVFVSSTFNDMQAEREELVKRVFPRIAALCRNRHVSFIEVDLRWGITDCERAEGKVLSICLEEIDRCRPFFIGLLGSRYGWVPDRLPSDLLEQFPQLASASSRSVTELEIAYGVLDDPTVTDRALLLLRRPDASSADFRCAQDEFGEVPTAEEIAELGADAAAARAARRTAQLEKLKERIRSSGVSVVDGYSTPQEVGKRVFEFLVAAIDQLFPPTEIPDALARVDAAQHALMSRHTGFFSPEGYVEGYLERTVSEAVPLLLVGEAGAGKSAILANWIIRQRSHTAGAAERPLLRPFTTATQAPLILAAFAEASSEQSHWRPLLRYLVGKLAQHCQLSREVPEEGATLAQTFANYLARAAATQPVILIIDGLDHLWAGDGAHSLFWLPNEFPEDVRVVLSSGPGPIVAEAEKRGWTKVNVPTLRKEQRRAIVEAKLSAYRKQLDSQSLQRVVSADGSRSPAYLAILLNEIRLHGQHETLRSMLTHYLGATDVHQLLALMLQRWERDYDADSPRLVGSTLSLLWACPSGLTEPELLELIEENIGPVSRIALSAFLHAAGELLIERAGRLTIAHRDLRAVAARRYLPDDDGKAQARLRVAQYFAARDYGLRRKDGIAGHSWHNDIVELAELYATAGAWVELATLLGDPRFLFLACMSSGDAVFRWWAAIEANTGIRMVDTYREAITAPNDFGAALELAELLAKAEHDEPALAVLTALIDRYSLPKGRFVSAGSALQLELGPYISTHGTERAMEAMQQQGLRRLLFDRSTIWRKRGQLDAALADVAKAERIAKYWHDKSAIAQCRLWQAEIALLEDKRDRAVRLLRAAIAMAKARDDGASIVAVAAARLGQTLGEVGRLEDARQSQEDAIEFCLTRASSSEIAPLFNNLGLIYAHLGSFEDARLRYQECEAWYRRMEGNAPAEQLGRALGNQAEMLEKLGRMDEAVPRYREAAKLFAKSGNTRLEWAALDALSVRLGKAVNEPSLHIRAADDDLAEAEAVFLRLLELESDAGPSGEVIARTASNVVVILNQRAIRLYQLGETSAAIDRLNRIIAVARAHRLSDAEEVAMELAEMWSAQAKESTALAGLACVHCGNTSDASLPERDHQFKARNRGREYYFAQCAACREKLAGTGYFALKMIVGSYPEIQLRRALAPGSDELWIA